MPARLPPLNDVDATRDALHAYAKVLGDWLKASRPRRRHWWHASLRPSIHGLTTGVIHSGPGFEFELDFVQSRLHLRTADDAQGSMTLVGQPASEVAGFIAEFTQDNGLSKNAVPEKAGPDDDGNFDDYDADTAQAMHEALFFVAAAMQRLRAGIAGETSPIQLWPHHFDLSMLWLPGDKIAGEDPDDEEASDKQLNFGFVFGDAGIGVPYLYITAYPFPDDMTGVELPDGTSWKTEGFKGAVLAWETLLEQRDPAACLDTLYRIVLDAGKKHL